LIELDCPAAEELEADGAWWEIYDEAFPASEREPRGVVSGSVARGVAVAARLRDRGRTCGLGSAHLLRDPPSVFLVYLAVEAQRRGHGLGVRLLEHVWQTAAARMAEPPLGMVWEVDLPALATQPAEVERRARRIGFFRRCGGVLLARPYAQPPLSPGAAPVPMGLMVRGALDIERAVRAIYFEKYGAQNGISAELLESLLGA
jgi:GNAT superfamily N-acetyltransferase